MSARWTKLGANTEPAITFENNAATPIVVADIGKPVRPATANGKDIILCSASDPVRMILIEVPRVTNAAGNFTNLVCATQGVHQVPYTGTAPDPTGAAPFVKADGSGGVTTHTAYLGAVCIAVNTTAGTCDILLG